MRAVRQDQRIQRIVTQMSDRGKGTKRDGIEPPPQYLGNNRNLLSEIVESYFSDLYSIYL